MPNYAELSISSFYLMIFRSTKVRSLKAKYTGGHHFVGDREKCRDAELKL